MKEKGFEAILIKNLYCVEVGLTSEATLDKTSAVELISKACDILHNP